ncbi:site-specific integrase [Paracoccus sp. Z118]|uniref:site-specific integrase n=1 Tax=Paracoccus sp. Z118 TaxID=2851017 RepID=UPI001C2C6310|nr:site-specific integrase [Paracoccus sp. Z118]MBV0892313.1 site-specific integrase [Paracoccus sp. Z118]
MIFKNFLIYQGCGLPYWYTGRVHMGLRMATPWKHPDTGVFYLRERVPAALVTKAKGRVVTLSFNGLTATVKLGAWAKASLRTKDIATAKERFREATAALQEHLRLIQQAAEDGPVRLTQRQTEALAGEYYRDLCSDTHENPGDPDDWENQLSALHDLGETAEGREGLHGRSADHILQSRGLNIDVVSRTALLTAMHEALVQHGKYQQRRGGGDYRPDLRADRFPTFENGATSDSTKSSKKPSADKATGPTLTGLFEAWEKDAKTKGVTASTIRDFRQKVNDLIAFIEHDRIGDITPEAIVKWTDHLRDGRGLNSKTIGQKYLAAVKRMFSYAKSRAMGLSDPTEGIVIETAKRVVNREKGYSDQEAKQVLAAAKAGVGISDKMADHTKRAIRWVPWVCAHSGARVTEIVQLRREDFQTIEGVPCIRITPEAGSVKTKQFRTVPLHPQLVQEGLLEMVEGLPTGPIFYAPGTGPQGISGRLGTWVKEHAKVSDEDLQPNHAWRHRFKTLCHDHDIAQEWADALQGHANPRAAERYGDRKVNAKYREICKLPRYEWPK